MSGRQERTHHFTAASSDEGKRLDTWLCGQLADLSRSRIQTLIRGGEVLVDGLRVKTGHSLRAAEQIQVRIPPPEPMAVKAEDIPLDIIFEDEHLAVINKAPGMTVHPAPGHRTGTMVHALLHHLGDVSPGADPFRPGIVHRLDKDTSGLLLVARNERIHHRLADMIAAREVKRRYQALIWGHLLEAEGEISAPIGRDPGNRKRMAVVESGKSALTRYSRIDSLPVFDYIRVELETGRTHQIRVHLGMLGHPVLGDPLYGGRKGSLMRRPRAEATYLKGVLEIMGRQALHAAELSFAHPADGRAMSFQAPLPEDMRAALDLMRSYRQTKE